MAAKIEFGPLARADGSATYSSNDYSIIAGVNGPLEVQRRDELPEEATLEVIVRPAAGVGGDDPRSTQPKTTEPLQASANDTLSPSSIKHYESSFGSRISLEH